MYGADVCTLLHGDHEKTLVHLDRLRRSEDPEERRRHFAAAASEIRLHRILEEEVFYPALDATLPHEASHGIIDRARAEQEETEAVLIRAESEGPGSPRFARTLQELWDRVQSHADTEENEIFSVVREHMDTTEMQRLGERLNRHRLEREGLYRGRAQTARAASEP